MTLRDDDIRAGVTLGKYEIVRKLATGGMAEIYLARTRGQAGFEKMLVLKRILPAFADDRALVTMFLDEARLAATLQHVNICDVFDVGAEGKNYFFAMEYIPGQDLRSIRLAAQRRRQMVPTEIVLAMARGTAAALHYAHTKTNARGAPLGLVHRDVTASNILISYDGAVKLVDFGIARATTRNTKTQTGMLKGKVPYLSPEQCLGWSVDGRSDLFSLGVVLYELTTGRRPFTGVNDYETMNAIVRTTAAPPSIIVADYLPELEAIVVRLLMTDAEERYQSAAALLDDLEALTKQHGLHSSALAIAKYMRELFAAELGTGPVPVASPITVDEVPTAPARIAGWPRAATEPYPGGKPPETLIEAAREYSVDIEVVTVARAPEPEVEPERPPPRAPTEVSGVFSVATRHDIVLPFDPIDARSAEILDAVDVDAPTNESDDDRMLRRISMLLERARKYFGVEDLSRAVAAIDLAMSENPTSERAQDMLDVNTPTISSIFTTFLGEPSGHLVLARPLEELANIPLSPRAAFLLTRLDAGVSIDDLLDISGMPRLEAQRYLCQLFLRGVVALA